MAGIIQTQINKDDPFSEIKGYEAGRVEEDPESSVESRVQNIIERGGPAVQSEVTRSQQEQNRKGLLSTSMAIGAGERARYDYALPIASQDSSQSLQRRITDASALNRASEFTAGQTNIAGQQERAGQQQLASIAAQSTAEQERDVALAGLTRDRDAALAEEAKVVASNLALTQGERDEALARIQTERDSLLAEEARGVAGTLAETAAARDASLAEEARAVAANAALTQSERDSELARIQGERDVLLSEQTQARDTALAQEAAAVAERKAENDFIMENVDAENAEALTRIQGEFSERLQASASAATIYQAHSSNITDILNNPQIPTSQKQQLIRQQTTLLRGALAIQEGISGIDLSGALNFSGTSSPGIPTAEQLAAISERYGETDPFRVGVGSQ